MLFRHSQIQTMTKKDWGKKKKQNWSAYIKWLHIKHLNLLPSDIKTMEVGTTQIV